MSSQAEQIIDPNSGDGGAFQARWRTPAVLHESIVGFKKWLANASSRGQVTVKLNGVIALSQQLSDSFCTGMVDFRHFLGVPHDDGFWINLPICALGVDPAAGAMVVCIQPVQAEEGGGETLSGVAIVLPVDQPVYCARVVMHPYIDLRTIVVDGAETHIGRVAFDAIPTFLTDSNRSSSEILADAREAMFSSGLVQPA